MYVCQRTQDILWLGKLTPLGSAETYSFLLRLSACPKLQPQHAQRLFRLSEVVGADQLAEPACVGWLREGNDLHPATAK
jgi:hypothetical protein